MTKTLYENILRVINNYPVQQINSHLLLDVVPYKLDNLKALTLLSSWALKMGAPILTHLQTKQYLFALLQKCNCY